MSTCNRLCSSPKLDNVRMCRMDYGTLNAVVQLLQVKLGSISLSEKNL